MYRYQLDNRDLLCKIGGDLALAAARAGDYDDAMRFYQKVVNYDRSLYRGRMPQLAWSKPASSEMKAQLRSYYQQMAQSDPDSTIPAEALLALEQPQPPKGPGRPLARPR
jgi:hypothetical protein